MGTQMVPGKVLLEDGEGWPLCSFSLNKAHPHLVLPGQMICGKRAVCIYRSKSRRRTELFARCPYHEMPTALWEQLEMDWTREVVDADLNARLARDRAGKS